MKNPPSLKLYSYIIQLKAVKGWIIEHNAELAIYMTLQNSPENKEKPPHESSPWQNHSTPWLLCDTCHVYQYNMGGQSLHTPCAQPSCLCNGSVAERWNWSYDRLATSWCHQAIRMVQQMLAPHKIWSSLLSLSNIPVVQIYTPHKTKCFGTQHSTLLLSSHHRDCYIMQVITQQCLDL